MPAVSYRVIQKKFISGTEYTIKRKTVVFSKSVNFHDRTRFRGYLSTFERPVKLPISALVTSKII